MERYGVRKDVKVDVEYISELLRDLLLSANLLMGQQMPPDMLGYSGSESSSATLLRSFFSNDVSCFFDMFSNWLGILPEKLELDCSTWFKPFFILLFLSWSSGNNGLSLDVGLSIMSFWRFLRIRDLYWLPSEFVLLPSSSMFLTGGGVMGSLKDLDRQSVPLS